MKYVHAATSRNEENGLDQINVEKLEKINIESRMISRKSLRIDKTTSRALKSIK